MNAEEHAADLLTHGYVEITEHKHLHLGQRVRHGGQRWSGAYQNGTATIERIFRSPRLIQGQEDVELIVKRDKPFLDSPHGFWADYHTCTVEES